MSENPFAPQLRDGVLELWLDTPRSDVNIFSREAAEQLREQLTDLPAAVRAVVFRSAKRGSFVNGVGLLLAGTLHHADDAVRLTAAVRDAYRAVRGLGVPTIAAVQGTCYGCGVEFALHADHRVAERVFDTHFYMTEIADYLFLPAFGATQDLPKLVGLKNAADLLLWGERWGADEALARGLVDACFDPPEFEARLAAFVDEVSSGRSRARPEAVARSAARARPVNEHSEEIVARTLERIARLPPSYRPLYEQCLELLVAGADPGTGEAGYARELTACGRSLTHPIAKSAVSFFFVREFAKAKCRRKASVPQPLRVSFRGLSELRQDLAHRRPRDVELSDANAADASLRLAPYAELSAGHSARRAATANETGIDAAAAVALDPVFAPVSWNADLIAYAPLYPTVRFFEIAERGSPAANAGVLFEVLERAGFGAVSTQPTSRFALDLLLEAYFAPLRAFVQSGGAPDDAARTLRDFGCVRGPADLAAALPAPIAPELHGADAARGVAVVALLDAHLVSLLDFVRSSRRDGSVGHPSLIDLMAREVLDFPLAHTSLCRYLTAERVAHALANADQLSRWVERSAVERAREYAHEGRSFYQ